MDNSIEEAFQRLDATIEALRFKCGPQKEVAHVIFYAAELAEHVLNLTQRIERLESALASTYIK